MDIDKKINMAINICNGGKYKRPRFLTIYPFTTENISGYIDMFDLKDKSLLTVGSSGDQVLNAILNGCKDVTLFDICAFAEEYYYLKLAALNVMNREEYLNFFCYRNYARLFSNNKKAFLDSNFYALLDYLQAIKPESEYFWNELLKKYSGKYIRKHLFSRDEYERKLLTQVNRYLETDEAYKSLKEKINNAEVNFIYDNIFNIKDDIKYDNIWLSNIATYYKLNDIKYLFDRCYNALNDNGKVLISYLYDMDLEYEYTPKEDEIYNLKAAYETISSDIKYSEFIGNTGLRMNNRSSIDGVITYKKVKKS